MGAAHASGARGVYAPLGVSWRFHEDSSRLGGRAHLAALRRWWSALRLHRHALVFVPRHDRRGRFVVADSRGGKAGFYAAKARVDADGFRCVIQLAAARGAITPTAVPRLWVGFRVRLAATLAREGQHRLALEQMNAARAVSIEATERHLAARGWNTQRWARADG